MNNLFKLLELFFLHANNVYAQQNTEKADKKVEMTLEGMAGIPVGAKMVAINFIALYRFGFNMIAWLGLIAVYGLVHFLMLSDFN